MSEQFVIGVIERGQPWRLFPPIAFRCRDFRGIRCPFKVIREDHLIDTPRPQYTIRNDPPYTKNRYRTQAVDPIFHGDILIIFSTGFVQLVLQAP